MPLPFRNLARAIGSPDDPVATDSTGSWSWISLLKGIQQQLVGVTGTVPIARGGTGQTAKAAGFDALAPTTTRGDLIFRNATTNARLAAGTSGFALMAAGAGADPVWAGFQRVDTGAVARTWNAKASDFVDAADFGVSSGASAAVNLAGLQAAVDTGRIVRLPEAATIPISGTVTIGVSGTGIVGGSMMTSVLTSNSTTLPMFSVTAGVNNVKLSGFKLTRSVTAASGAHGISFAGNTEETHISNLWIEKQYIGLALLTTSYSLVENLVITDCRNDGLVINDTASSGGLQWSLSRILSQQNAGRGILVATSGTHSSSVGGWENLFTYANDIFGIAVIGTASAPINGIRLSKFFLGQDGNTELYLDTYGSLHNISSGYAELAGTSNTGPALGTAPSGIGSGFVVTANNVRVLAASVYATQNSVSGISMSAATWNSLSGSFGTDNGAYGLVFADGAKAQVNGSYFAGNATADQTVTSNAASLVGNGNSPNSLNSYISPTLTGNPVLSFGGTTTGKMGATSNYNVISLNSSITLAGALGVFGGASGDTNTLYLAAPGAIRYYFNGVDSYNATAASFSPTVDNSAAIGDSSHRWSNGFYRGTLNALNATATTAGGAAAAGLALGTAALGVYFGSGLPTITAPQGSLYLRTDGSSTSTRLYVNTTGSTTWTNVVTAA